MLKKPIGCGQIKQQGAKRIDGDGSEESGKKSEAKCYTHFNYRSAAFKKILVFHRDVSGLLGLTGG